MIVTSTLAIRTGFAPRWMAFLGYASLLPRRIMGVFQILWVYYGLLILSRPVILWNMVGVVINFLTVGAYLRCARTASNPSA